MKVLHINTQHLYGGASRAAYRLHTGLLAAGIESEQLVKQKMPYQVDTTAYEPDTLLEQLWGKLAYLREGWLKFRHYEALKQANILMTTAWYRNGISRAVQRLDPDIVHIHWPGMNFVPIPSLRHFKRPIVWTFHDMWAFTGGCHYAFDCTRYEQACGCCPQLASDDERDLTRRTWQRKQRLWDDVPITAVTPSRWMGACARASSLFADRRVEVIPNGLDVERYRPHDQQAARDILGLPRDKKLILFGAMMIADWRKGADYLPPVISRLRDQYGDAVALVAFGQASQPLDLGMPVHTTGLLNDDVSLSLLYSAVDLFLAPSVQDNLPNTVLEALACGTPCAAFQIGGMPDMIDHQQNGYLAPPFDVADLAAGVQWMLSDDRRWQTLSQNARRKVVEHFDLSDVARRHAALYEELLST